MSQWPDEVFCDNVFYAVEHIYKGYSQRNLSIPGKQSESWYLGMMWGFFDHFMGVKDSLDCQPDEICLQASSWRKNKGRSLESKHMMGRKADGVVVASASRLELCVIEAAKSDNGSTGTKALSDTMKLAKSMKDMSDLIRSKSSSDTRDEVVTFGIRVLGCHDGHLHPLSALRVLLSADVCGECRSACQVASKRSQHERHHLSCDAPDATQGSNGGDGGKGYRLDE
ncbi:hypothetical protein EDD21DRAFT_438756 [Dissophora ornata]|nr:hypothetical protein EDD21DRAFT_438756 [Dissophora ornata]